MSHPPGDDVPPTGPATEPPVEPVPVPLEPAPLARIHLWEVGLVVLAAALLYLPRLGSYGLWDPWETHYAEVARRMLEDHDWVRLKWQNENFRSKPVLTFWLMAAGMKLFGVGEDGGWSGEFVASTLPQWGLRLPFALFGILGIGLLWYTLARLASRRVAWLAAGVLATSPYYFLISRQAITDMPSCVMLIGSLALFALAVFEDPDRPLVRWRGVTPYHLFLAVYSIIVLGQLVYFTGNLAGSRLFVGPGRSVPGVLILVPFYAAYVLSVAVSWGKTRSMNQVYMYWFYLLNGVAVLAKGPVGPGLAGLSILAYLALSGQWRLLRHVEIPRGVLIALVVCLPWHFAIFVKDGMPWLNEYLNQHLLNRAFKGVHGDRGTFDYFFGQLGVGMWPWVAMIPAALAGFFAFRHPTTRDGRLRLLFGIWAIVGYFFFSAIQTKFHHYVLPAVPGFAALIAYFVVDVLDGPEAWGQPGRLVRGSPTLALVLCVVLFVVTAIDVVSGQQRFVHLYIYRYDRPWPAGAPWNIDFTRQLFGLALVLGAALALLCWRRTRRPAAFALVAASVLFTVFTMQRLMVAVSPHWGQRTLHEVYYHKRKILGADLVYAGWKPFVEDWSSGGELEVRSVVPETLHVGDTMKVTVALPDGKRQALAGSVGRTGENRFWITFAPGELSKLSADLDRARANPTRGRRWLSVNADRLIAWQLNWRGENFYSGGEIWDQQLDDARTVFVETDNKKFLEYLKHPDRTGKGRKFWVVTEKGRLEGLRNVLPTPKARETFRVESDSSNKFGLGSFQLD